MIIYGRTCAKQNKKINIVNSVIWIVFFDTFVAFLAGLMIFPTIYHYQALTGVELQNNGIILLFSSMPVVFNKLGVVGKLFHFLLWHG